MTLWPPTYIVPETHASTPEQVPEDGDGEGTLVVVTCVEVTNVVEVATFVVTTVSFVVVGARVEVVTEVDALELVAMLDPVGGELEPTGHDCARTEAIHAESACGYYWGAESVSVPNGL